MTIITEAIRGKEMWRQAATAWRWLKDLPRYQRDYRRQNKSNSKELLSRYGFFPLIDPKVKSACPTDFLIAFAKLFNYDFTNSSVRFLDISSLDFLAIENPKRFTYSPRPLPEWVRIAINPMQPINVILHEIERYLRTLKRDYKIKDKKLRIDDLSEIYIVHVAKNLKIKNAPILKMARDSTNNEDDKENKVKRMRRIIAKADVLRDK